MIDDMAIRNMSPKRKKSTSERWRTSAHIMGNRPTSSVMGVGLGSVATILLGA